MMHHNTKECDNLSVRLSAVIEYITIQAQNKYGYQAREALYPYQAEQQLVKLILDSIQSLKLRNKQ